MEKSPTERNLRFEKFSNTKPDVRPRSELAFQTLASQHTPQHTSIELIADVWELRRSSVAKSDTREISNVEYDSWKKTGLANNPCQKCEAPLLSANYHKNNKE